MGSHLNRNERREYELSLRRYVRKIRRLKKSRYCLSYLSTFLFQVDRLLRITTKKHPIYQSLRIAINRLSINNIFWSSFYHKNVLLEILPVMNCIGFEISRRILENFGNDHEIKASLSNNFWSCAKEILLIDNLIDDIKWKLIMLVLF